MATDPGPRRVGARSMGVCPYKVLTVKASKTAGDGSPALRKGRRGDKEKAKLPLLGERNYVTEEGGSSSSNSNSRPPIMEVPPPKVPEAKAPGMGIGGPLAPKGKQGEKERTEVFSSMKELRARPALGSTAGLRSGHTYTEATAMNLVPAPGVTLRVPAVESICLRRGGAGDLEIEIPGAEISPTSPGPQKIRENKRKSPPEKELRRVWRPMGPSYVGV